MPVRLRRRELIAALGGGVVWLRAARGQSAMPVIGFLNGATAARYVPFVAAFRRGLSEFGYIEGQNLTIEYRWADYHYDRLPALAADLIRRQVIMIAANTPAAPVAKAATTAIPIVFVTAGDPVAAGLVESLSRPGGNLTGVSLLNVEIGPKQLQLLHELVPTATIIALLINPNNPTSETQTGDIQAAARTLGLQLHVVHASTESDFDTAFATLVQLRTEALVIGSDALLINRSKQLAELALGHAVPAIFLYREFVEAGGLMSYGASLVEAYRLLGIYASRVLKGEKPANLPVQQATKVELIINLRTAKALGIDVPLALSGRANELIE
jgi:putative ABC transport system substrate-binding protein